MNGVGPRIASLVFSDTAVLEEKESRRKAKQWEVGREGNAKSNEGNRYFTSALWAPGFFRLVTEFPSLARRTM